jgi:hypothetical protein
VLATEPSFLVLKIEPVFEDSGEAGEPHYLHLANDWLAGEYRRAAEAIEAQSVQL